MATRQSRRTECTAIRDQRRLSPDDLRERATTLLEEKVRESTVDEVLVALSGGIDSSTTATLAVDALGADRVSGLLMPAAENRATNTTDAQRLASDLDIDYETIALQPILDVFERNLAPKIAPGGDKYVVGNLAARLRMACAYFVANTTSRLVVGTSNRTERLLGYFTKYGDGGADVLPLGEYYKTEVRTLADELGVPPEIIEKPSTAGFWVGQTDEADLGASYETLDRVLQALVDETHDAAAAARTLDLEAEQIREYAARVIRTAHKRSCPPTPERDVADAAPQPTFTTDRDEVAGLADRLTAFIREYVTAAGAEGVVVNMSGGLDSSVATALAVDALGPDRVYGLHLPCHKGAEIASVDPGTLATDLGIDYTRVNIHPLVSEIESHLPSHLTTAAGTRELGNLIARVRMACAYYAANTTSRLVLGTTNRTERLLGYFTKYGDGGGDLQPLGSLFKTEVRALAQHLNLPETVIDQPATAGFRAGQTDESDLGAPYGTIDEVLACLVDGNLGLEHTAAKLALDTETVRQYAEMHTETRHKRVTPPTTRTRKVADRTQYFHEIELSFY